MKNFFAKILSGTVGRLIRAGVATAAASVAASQANNELFIALGPTLQAFSKFLRDRYPQTWWDVLPF